jgi:hypothetical protein
MHFPQSVQTEKACPGRCALGRGEGPVGQGWMVVGLAVLQCMLPFPRRGHSLRPWHAHAIHLCHGSCGRAMRSTRHGHRETDAPLRRGARLRHRMVTKGVVAALLVVVLVEVRGENLCGGECDAASGIGGDRRAVNPGARFD